MNETADRFINILDPYIEKFLNILPVKWADDLALLHPYITIFAVSLPLIALGFQISKKADLYKAGNILYILGIITIIFSFLSGKSAYVDVKGNVSADGLELLNSHATFGMLILLSYIGILALKLLYLATKKDNLKSFITFLMYLEGALVFYMMISGIKLVFHYGAGFIL
jgi:uncharacterized membrane protein